MSGGPVETINGKRARANSTLIPLGAGETFTGEWEFCLPYASISILAYADVEGTLFADFSIDEDTVDRTIQLSSGDSIDFDIHSLIPVASFFRIRIVNGSTPQGLLRAQTIFNYGSRIALPTTRLAQIIHMYSDVLNIRVGNDVKLDTASGLIAGRSVVHKFGANRAVTASATEDVTQSGVINFLLAGDTIRVAAGGGSDDAAAGDGARKIIVQGLKTSDWTLQEVEITLNADGTLASASTTESFVRVFRAWPTDCGTYDGTNVEDINIETTGGIALVCIIGGIGQTQTTAFTVPAGKTAYLTRMSSHVEATRPADMIMWQRQNADVVVAPFTAKREVKSFPQVDGAAPESLDAYPSFPEKTDLWWTTTAGVGGDASVEADYDLTLVDN